MATPRVVHKVPNRSANQNQAGFRIPGTSGYIFAILTSLVIGFSLDIRKLSNNEWSYGFISCFPSCRLKAKPASVYEMVRSKLPARLCGVEFPRRSVPCFETIGRCSKGRGESGLVARGRARSCTISSLVLLNSQKDLGYKGMQTACFYSSIELCR